MVMPTCVTSASPHEPDAWPRRRIRLSSWIRRREACPLRVVARRVRGGRWHWPLGVVSRARSARYGRAAIKMGAVDRLQCSVMRREASR
jgi:hypothetical protein